MLVNFICTYILPHWFQKVQLVRLNHGFLEVKGIIYCIYVRNKGVSEFGEIFWIVLVSLFIVEHIVYKTLCFWKNGLGDRHGHICEEGNDTKKLWYAIPPLVFFLSYFDSP